jgi:hypothetical protein
MEPNWDACAWFNSIYSPLLYEKHFNSSIDILLAYTRLKIIGTPSICLISSRTLLHRSPVAALFPFPCPKYPLFFPSWCQLLFLPSRFFSDHISCSGSRSLLSSILYSQPSHPSYVSCVVIIVRELCHHFKSIININSLVADSLWVPQLLWQ